MEQSQRTGDVFAPLSSSEKAQFQEEYVAYLRQRDGEPDLENRRFSVRELFFQRLLEQPVQWSGPLPVEPSVFQQNEVRPSPQKGLDDLTLWALAVAKANRAERDGVEYALQRTDYSTRTADDPLTYIEIEEFYHTRILRDVLDVVGLEMQYLPPPVTTRFLTHSLYHVPKPVSNMLILCSEVVGVAGFRLLADKAKDLFSDQPEPLRRIDELFQQILVDEVGHVHYARSQLGSVRLNLARQMLPTVARRIFNDIPEFDLLFGRETLMEKVLTADVDGAAAGYADRFVPAYL